MPHLKSQTLASVKVEVQVTQSSSSLPAQALARWQDCCRLLTEAETSAARKAAIEGVQEHETESTESVLLVSFSTDVFFFQSKLPPKDLRDKHSRVFFLQ